MTTKPETLRVAAAQISSAADPQANLKVIADALRRADGAELVVLPEALGGGLLTLVQWVSQTFIQLVMLSVIMVGQNIMGRASDKRAVMTYQDASADFHETEQVQSHLKAQDDAINALLDKIDGMEAKLGGR